jgi:hypothetical protein
MDPAVPILMLALIALVSGVLCAVVASEKNRNSGAWGVVGFLFPILTLIAIAGMPEKTRRIRECLFCAELIGIKATICPFCNRELKPVVHCTYSYCDTTHIEPEQAVYRLCGKEGCDEQHAFCSESHANTEARENYDEAIRLNPQNAKAYNNRGVSYHELGEYNWAIYDYEDAIRLDPEYAEAYSNRGLTYQSLGQVEEAERDFQKAKELGYNP